MDPNVAYYKITNEKEIHNGYAYHDGLNILTEPFAETGSCVKGGFYFTTIEFIHKFFDYGVHLREISLPTTNPNFRMIKDPDGDKWRSNMIIFGKKHFLNEVSTYKFLIENGFCSHANGYYVLSWSAGNGYLEVVKFLVESGADIHADNDYALRWSSANNHLAVVEFLKTQH